MRRAASQLWQGPRPHTRRVPTTTTRQVNKNAGTSTTVLPDYNTSVNVADITLTKARRPGSWKGLDDLKQVRRNAVAKGPRG